MIAAPPPPPATAVCAAHRIAANVRGSHGLAGITWRIDRRLIARLRPWQGVAFLPGPLGPGGHVLTATLVSRDHPPLTIVVARFTVCR